MSDFLKKTLDEYMQEFSLQKYLNRETYVPSEFALKFIAFQKLAHAEFISEGKMDSAPVMHYAMLDQYASTKRRHLNLCGRGLGKTALSEDLCLYLGVFRNIEGFGEVPSLLYITDSLENGVKSFREAIREKYERSSFLKKYIPKIRITESEIDLWNLEGKHFGIRMLGVSAGVRGKKIKGNRPTIIIFDDLMSDKTADSPAELSKMKEAVFKGAQYAVDPKKYKLIFNGTPFNKNDVILEALESGAWHVNVWPVCRRFPCEKKEFEGSWPDRFTYEHVKDAYYSAKAQGKEAGFRQELMLQITDDESRLVKNADIEYYDNAKYKDILDNKDKYNFYITTDFATSSKQTADFAVLMVWAYDSNNNWYWVDGIVRRQSMGKSIDKLFSYCKMYKPQGVGVEVTGQQGGFIDWIFREMNTRNVFFNLTGEKGKPGIRPIVDKLSRFNLVVPLFKMGKIAFPKCMEEDSNIKEIMSQISLVTYDGIKGKDDAIDAISMLNNMYPFAPAKEEDDKNISLNVSEFGNVFGGDEWEQNQYNYPIENYTV